MPRPGRYAERKVVECPCGCGEKFEDRHKCGKKRKYAKVSCLAGMKWGKTAAEKYERCVVRNGENECWGWNGTKPGGYGSFRCKGETLKAHRFAYSHFVAPIPEGLLVLHKCDNPECTNPNHLFLGTQQENIADMNKKGRNGLTRHSAEKKTQVLEMRAAGMKLAEIGEKLGMSFQYVGALCQRGKDGHPRSRTPKSNNQEHRPVGGISAV